MRRAGTADSHGVDLALGQSGFVTAVDDAPAGNFRHVAQGDVGADGLGQQQALALAVFGDQGNTMTDRVHRRANAHHLGRRTQGHGAAVGRVGAEDQAQQFGAAGANQAGNAIDLTGAHFKGHIANLVRTGQARHRQGRATDGARAQVNVFAQFATDHQGHQLLTVVIGHRLDADQLAVAQYRNALGDTGQLFEPVRNINDRHASGLQAGDLFEQHLDFTSSEHRRGLVEDQHMAVADQVTGDLDHLLVTNAQAAHQRVRVDRVQADLGHGFDRGFAQLFAADPATAARQVIQE